MSDGPFYIVHETARKRAHDAIDRAEYGCKVTLQLAPKTRPQEERYHAMIGDIASQWEFCGRQWNAEDMKRLLVDQFHRDTKDDPELKKLWEEFAKVDMAPSIDRTGVVALGIQTRRFGKKLAAAFIEWLFAFGAEREVEWTNETRRTGVPA